MISIFVAETEVETKCLVEAESVSCVLANVMEEIAWKLNSEDPNAKFKTPKEALEWVQAYIKNSLISYRISQKLGE